MTSVPVAGAVVRAGRLDGLFEAQPRLRCARVARPMSCSHAAAGVDSAPFVWLLEVSAPHHSGAHLPEVCVTVPLSGAARHERDRTPPVSALLDGQSDACSGRLARPQATRHGGEARERQQQHQQRRISAQRHDVRQLSQATPVQQPRRPRLQAPRRHAPGPGRVSSLVAPSVFPDAPSYNQHPIICWRVGTTMFGFFRKINPSSAFPLPRRVRRTVRQLAAAAIARRVGRKSRMRRREFTAAVPSPRRRPRRLRRHQSCARLCQGWISLCC